MAFTAAADAAASRSAWVNVGAAFVSTASVVSGIADSVLSAVSPAAGSGVSFGLA